MNSGQSIVSGVHAIDRAWFPFWAVSVSGWPAALSKLNKLHLQFVMLFYRQKTGQEDPQSAIPT
jgi:hypothetical protein